MSIASRVLPLTALPLFLCALAGAAPQLAPAQRAGAAPPPGTGSAGGGGALLPQTGLGGPPQWVGIAEGAEFLQASATTRTAGVAFTQPCPFNLVLPPLPPGAVVLESFMVWNYLSDAAPAGDTVNLNGNPVNGIQIGAGTGDLCWGKTGAVSYLATGVHPLLNLGGANLVGGLCDKALGADPNALGEGLTVLVAYEIPGQPKRIVNLWWGYTSTESSASGNADAALGLFAPFSGGKAHFFLNALDGQTLAGDNLLFNGLPASGLLAGTGLPGNAWVGLAGPLAASNLYDAIDDHVNAWVAVGDTTLQVRTVKIGDCVGHSFAAFTQSEACGPATTYCTAKLNSLGCTPAISATGTPSTVAGSPAFDVSVAALLNNKPAIMIYGFGQAALPFQGGLLCVAPPITRSGVQSTGGNPPPDDCSGVFQVDFNTVLQSGVDPALVAGATVCLQVWSRDVLDPFGSSLSDALAFDVCQ